MRFLRLIVKFSKSSGGDYISLASLISVIFMVDNPSLNLAISKRCPTLFTIHNTSWFYPLLNY